MKVKNSLYNDNDILRVLCFIHQIAVIDKILLTPAEIIDSLHWKLLHEWAYKNNRNFLVKTISNSSYLLVQMFILLVGTSFNLVFFDPLKVE